MAVHASLERFDRPYFYTAGVPDWLLARESDAEEEEGPSGFEQDYRRFEEGQRPKRSIKEVPHCA